MAVALAMLGTPALASPGCDAVNAGNLDVMLFSGTPRTVNAAFAAGEQITIFIDGFADPVLFNGTLTFTLGAASVVRVGAPVFDIKNFTATLTANGTEVTASILITGGVADADTPVTFTCFDPLAVPPAPPPAPVAPKNNLPQMQQKTKLSAQAAGSAFSGAIGAAVSEGFAGGCDAVTPLADGVRINITGWRDRDPACFDDNRRFNVPDRMRGRAARPDRPDNAARPVITGRATATGQVRPGPAVLPRDWQLWLEVRGTEFRTSQGGESMSGMHLNALIGLTHHIATDLVIGVYAGYENSRVTSDAIAGRLTGKGGTIGNYLGWRIAEGLRFDAGYGYTRVGYDISASLDPGGMAYGSFTGDRWMFTSGLTGNYVWRAFTFEPSVRAYWLNEKHHAYADSTGTVQQAQSYTTGRGSAGNKVIFPTQSLGTFSYAPFVGFYGDYYFTASDSIAALTQAGASTLTIQGWSGRATAGLTLKLRNGTQFMGSGEYGGLGGRVQIWTYRGRMSVPF